MHRSVFKLLINFQSKFNRKERKTKSQHPSLFAVTKTLQFDSFYVDS